MQAIGNACGVFCGFDPVEAWSMEWCCILVLGLPILKSVVISDGSVSFQIVIWQEWLSFILNLELGFAEREEEKEGWRCILGIVLLKSGLMMVVGSDETYWRGWDPGNER